VTGPRGYDIFALSTEFDIDMHIAVAGRTPLRLRRKGLTDSAERDLNRSSFEKSFRF
jgi:hypothetical protein